jgi:dihydroflavonol-4-reductase
MILVTGGTGHIGNVLIRRLLSLGEKVRVLILPGEDCASIYGLDVDCIEGNVLDPISLTNAFQGIRDVYHLAGMISIMPGWNQIVRQVNLDGTRNVLQAARDTNIRRLIYTSSIHALNRAPHGITIDEDIPFDPLHAISAYDQSKAEASLAVMEASRQGLNAVIACPTGVIGPYDFRGSEMGQVILDAMKNRPQFTIDGSYDFVDVRDVAEGLIQAGKKGRSGESYILSGERITINWLVQVVQKLAGVKNTIMQIPMGLARFIANFAPSYYRLTRTRPRFTPYALATIESNSVISNNKARRELGYSPRSLSETVADTVRWYRENRAFLKHTNLVRL